MQSIPLQAKPSQTIQVTLGDQITQINVYQLRSGLYCDVSVSGLGTIIAGVICQNINRIVRSLYLGFKGDLVFWDSQGDSDPDYTGLGGRFQLVWVTPDDLTALGFPA